MNRILKTEEDYRKALAELEALIEQDPDPSSPAGEQLQFLKLLIGDYETKHFPEELPDPIEAIKFYMEQRDLSPRDLIPFIGSRSKVSEVLSRKRSLTLPMIRALQKGLGIPAKVLIQEGAPSSDVDWGAFPLREMIDRGWLKGEKRDVIRHPQKVLADFLAPLGTIEALMLLPKASHLRSGKEMNRHALLAWACRIYRLASVNPPSTRYKADTVTPDFIRTIGKLSAVEDGPLQAREHLRQAGISLIVESHLPETYLDAAALILGNKNPVIGLTLRYDRLDNFWFSLAHELAHLALHLKGQLKATFDDLDAISQGDQREIEADEMAGEALIPRDLWLQSPARLIPSPEAAYDLAEQLTIHPAIVAGRIRHEKRSFRLLGQMVGYGEVRRLFESKSRD
jgi:HTH-type transcriptional regulator/antitoxin HigA